MRDDPCRSAARFSSPPRYAPAPCFASIPAPIRSAQTGRGCARMADALAPCLLVAHRPPLRASGRTLRSPAPFGRRCPPQAAHLPYPDHHPRFASIPAPLRYAHTGRGCARMADALAPCLLVAHRPPLRAAVRTLRSPAPYGGGALRSPPSCPTPTTTPASLAPPPLFASLKRGGGALAWLTPLPLACSWGTQNRPKGR